MATSRYSQTTAPAPTQDAAKYSATSTRRNPSSASHRPWYSMNTGGSSAASQENFSGTTGGAGSAPRRGALRSKTEYSVTTHFPGIGPAACGFALEQNRPAWKHEERTLAITVQRTASMETEK